jgi:hypothetical protein
MTKYEAAIKALQANEQDLTVEQEKFAQLTQALANKRDSILAKLQNGDKLSAERTRLFASPEGTEEAEDVNTTEPFPVPDVTPAAEEAPVVEEAAPVVEAKSSPKSKAAPAVEDDGEIPA